MIGRLLCFFGFHDAYLSSGLIYHEGVKCEAFVCRRCRRVRPGKPVRR